MKRAGKFAVSVVSGMLCLNSLRAEDVVLPGNPYAVVVVRNIFGLNPPPVVDPNATVIEPPVKIIPNGIMTIFGQLQVLFKVPAKPGSKDKDANYILTEGQRQDDIEVTKINESKGIVTFNNHGIVQELPLVVTAPSSTPSTPTGGPAGGAGVHVPKIASGTAAGNNLFGQRSSSQGSGGNQSNGNANVGGGSPQNTSYLKQPDSVYTVDEAAVAMEVNREVTKQQVIDGEMPPIPPTPLTPDDATGSGGGPLVAPPTAPNPNH